MSVQSGPTFKRYAANGVTTVYAIPFLLLDAADLLVTLDGVEVVSGFVLTGVGNPSSTCTFSAAPTGDLLFQLSIPFQRLADYQENGDLLSGTLNNDLDRLWLAIKQLSGGNDRALSTGVLEPEGIPALPVAAVRALKLLAFDALSNPVASTLTLSELEQQPALALASAQAAANSAAAALVSEQSANISELAAAQSAINAATSEGNAAATLATAQKQYQSISATVSANALTLGWVAVPNVLRSATLTNGTPNTRTPGANLSLVVPSGATLGTASGVAARLALLLLDNAGTVELAVANAGGGIDFDENKLISTTAISAGATSASAIYSAVSRTNVPFRLVGYHDITEVTAGTWATPPSVQQPAGGSAMNPLAAAIRKFVSPPQAITLGGGITLNHNIAGIDLDTATVKVFAICNTAQNGFVVGDRFEVAQIYDASTTSGYGIQRMLTTTQVKLRVGNTLFAVELNPATGGGGIGLVAANFTLTVVVKPN